jgi:hypothetical protein
MDTGLVTNRELATLVWVAALIVYVALQGVSGGVAKSLRSALRSLLSPKALTPLLLYMAWLAGIVWLGEQIRLWQPALLKPTIVWAVFSGVGLFFGFTKALARKSFFREALLGSVGATLLVEYYVNFVSFPLVLELILQPVAILAAVIGAYSARRPDHKGVVKLCNRTLILIGSVSFAWVLWNLATRWSEIDVAMAARELFLPLWLTPAALAFVYLLAVYAGYESAFTRIDWKSQGDSSWRVKLAYISLVGLNLRTLRVFDGGVQMRGASESSFKAARSTMLAEVNRRKKKLEPNTESAPEDVEQVTWSKMTANGCVTLKGDLPNGYPTETWIDDRLVDRDLDGDFSWDLRASLPSPVALIEALTDCRELESQADFWERGGSHAPTVDSAARQRAFAQAARDRALDLDCLTDQA